MSFVPVPEKASGGDHTCQGLQSKERCGFMDCLMATVGREPGAQDFGSRDHPGLSAPSEKLWREF